MADLVTSWPAKAVRDVWLGVIGGAIVSTTGDGVFGGTFVANDWGILLVGLTVLMLLHPAEEILKPYSTL